MAVLQKHVDSGADISVACDPMDESVRRWRGFAEDSSSLLLLGLTAAVNHKASKIPFVT